MKPIRWACDSVNHMPPGPGMIPRGRDPTIGIGCSVMCPDGLNSPISFPIRWAIHRFPSGPNARPNGCVWPTHVVLEDASVRAHSGHCAATGLRDPHVSVRAHCEVPLLTDRTVKAILGGLPIRRHRAEKASAVRVGGPHSAVRPKADVLRIPGKRVVGHHRVPGGCIRCLRRQEPEDETEGKRAPQGPMPWLSHEWRDHTRGPRPRGLTKGMVFTYPTACGLPVLLSSQMRRAPRSSRSTGRARRGSARRPSRSRA